jgi:hypothetical protein
MDVPEKSRKLFGVHPPQNNPQTKITQKEKHRSFSGVFLFMWIFRRKPPVACVGRYPEIPWQAW